MNTTIHAWLDASFPSDWQTGVIVLLAILLAAAWLLRAALAPIQSAGLAMAQPSSARCRIKALQRRVYAAGLPRGLALLAIAAGLIGAGLLGATSLTRAEGDGEEPKSDSNQKASDRAADFQIAGHTYLYNSDRKKNGDEEPVKTPLIKVQVTLYVAHGPLDPLEKVAETASDDDGHFQFTSLLPPRTEMHFDRRAYAVLAQAEGRPPVAMQLYGNEDPQNIDFFFDRDAHTATLSGKIVDEAGEPVRGATIVRQDLWNHAVPGFQSAVSDQNGRFQIDNLPVDAKPRSIGYSFRVRHPDHPTSEFAVPQLPATATFTLPVGCILSGLVIDEVTGKPAAGPSVSAESTSNVSDDAFARTDATGRYRLVVGEGSYNILAEGTDLAGIALVDQLCENGKSLELPPIKLAVGGWIEGQVIASATSAPVAESEGRPISLGVYGPSYPLREHNKHQYFSGVVMAEVDHEGRFKLPAAAGKNYPYLYNAYGRRDMLSTLDQPPVIVKAGEATHYDMLIDPIPTSEETMAAARKVLAALPQEREARIASIVSQFGDKAHTWDAVEAWCLLLRDLVEMGPEAVPQITQSLDNTKSGTTLLSLAFVLRAIGDPRAVPALIRAIPKTLRHPESDCSVEIEDDDLAAFMSKYDTGPGSSDFISLGRPVNEIFATLKALTGRELGDQTLVSITRSEDPNGVALQQPIFHREAQRWQTWWEANWQRFTKDQAYATVNLQPEEAVAVRPVLKFGADTKLSQATWKQILSPPGEEGDYLLDLDTGLELAWPADVPREETAGAEADLDLWAAKNGADLTCVTYRAADGKPTYALRALGMRAWEIPRHDAETIKSWLTTGKLPAMELAGDLLLHQDEKSGRYDPATNAAFLYVTREGGMGLIQVTDRVTVKIFDGAFSRPPRGGGKHLVVRFDYSRIVP